MSAYDGVTVEMWSNLSSKSNKNLVILLSTLDYMKTFHVAEWYHTCAINRCKVKTTSSSALLVCFP